MRMSLVFFALILSIFVSGCRTVTEHDLADLQSPNAIVKKEAVNRISRGRGFPFNLIGPFVSKDNEEKAVTIMVELLRSGNGSKDAKLNILKALGELGKRTEIPADPLIEKLKDKDPDVRRWAIEALGKTKNKKALPALVKLLEQQTDKYPVIWAIGEIGDQGAIPHLGQLLASEDKYVTYNAYRALAKIGTSEKNLVGSSVPAASSGVFQPSHSQSIRHPVENVAVHQAANRTDRPGSGKSLAASMDQGALKSEGPRATTKKQTDQAPLSRKKQKQEIQKPQQVLATKPKPEKATTLLNQGASKSEGPRATGKKQTDQAPLSRKKQKQETQKPQQVLATKPKPEKATTLYSQALALQGKGSLQEAKKLYEGALETSPNLVSALNNIGVIYMKEKNYGAARGVLEKAVKIKPNYVDPYYNLACLYAVQKNVGQSLSYLRKAVSVDEAARRWAKTDGDLENLHGHSEYENIVRETKSL